MADWDIWVRDTRRLPTVRVDTKRVLQVALEAHGIQLVEGPLALVPPERYPGEWICHIRDRQGHNHEWLKLRIRDALEPTTFELARAPFPKRPQLRSVRSEEQ